MGKDDVRSVLRTVGQRATPQRLAILTALQEAGGHLTASDLLARVDSTQVPSLNVSTVYRTLASAERAGLVLRFQREGTDDQFEWYQTNHHHLVCHTCGSLSELPHTPIEKLSSDIGLTHGFSIRARHLAIPGTCAGCGEPPTHVVDSPSPTR